MTVCQILNSRTGEIRQSRWQPQDHGWATLSSRKIVYRHLCHDKRCSNPEHIVIDTQSANTLDIDVPFTGSLTHCPNGHERTKENTRITPGSLSHSPQRVCKTCNKERMQRERRNQT